MKFFCLTMFTLIIVLIDRQGHAFVNCGNNPTNVTKYISMDIVSSDDTFLYEHGTLVHDALITCQFDPNYKSRTANFYPFENSNITNTSSKRIGLLYFSKITGTTNQFLNDHGWIYYFYKDPLSAGVGRWISGAQAPLYLSSNSNSTPSQGIQFDDFKIFLDKLPTEDIVNVTIRLGTLTAYVSDEMSSKLYTSTPPQIVLNMKAVPLKTCIVSGVDVRLPTVLTSEFNRSIPSEHSTRTNFNVTAICSKDLISKTLKYSFIDNFNTSNSTTTVTNSNTNSNVKLKIYSSTSISAIPMRDIIDNTFGAVNASTNSVTKNFNARYYKDDYSAAKAGPVKSQVTLTIIYP